MGASSGVSLTGPITGHSGNWKRGSRRRKHPSKRVRPGDQVEAVVLEVHPRDRRISLGLKQLEPNPWTTIDSRYSVGSVVEGRVRNMTDFGAFFGIEEGIDGLAQ